MTTPKDAVSEGFDIRAEEATIDVTHTLTAGQEMDQSNSLREGDYVTLRVEENDVLLDSIERSGDDAFVGQIRSFPGQSRKTFRGLRLGDTLRFRHEHVFSVIRTITLGAEL